MTPRVEPDFAKIKSALLEAIRVQTAERVDVSGEPPSRRDQEPVPDRGSEEFIHYIMAELLEQRPEFARIPEQRRLDLIAQALR